MTKVHPVPPMTTSMTQVHPVKFLTEPMTQFNPVQPVAEALTIVHSIQPITGPMTYTQSQARTGWTYLKGPSSPTFDRNYEKRLSSLTYDWTYDKGPSDSPVYPWTSEISLPSPNYGKGPSRTTYHQTYTINDIKPSSPTYDWSHKKRSIHFNL